MNIIKIGDEYVNLDNITSISIGDHKISVRVGGFHYYITEYHTQKLREVLDNLSKSTEGDSREK